MSILFLLLLFFPAVPYSSFLCRLLYSISILIFFVLISVQTNSDHSKTCNGQAIAVSRPTPCPTPCTPFSVIATVIVRIDAHQFFLCFFSFFILLIFGLSSSSFVCIDCCPPYRFSNFPACENTKKKRLRAPKIQSALQLTP